VPVAVVLAVVEGDAPVDRVAVADVVRERVRERLTDRLRLRDLLPLRVLVAESVALPDCDEDGGG